MGGDSTPKVNASVTTCPACGVGLRDLFGTKNEYWLLRCCECGTIYCECSPLDYDNYYDDNNLEPPAFIRQRYDELIAGLSAWRKTNRLLELGCGAGAFLQAARRANWDAEGLEVSKRAAEHVRLLGLKVFCGELSKANYPADYFDVVIAIELIEHLAEPFRVLSEVARIIRPGGMLWATTPNARSLSARLLRTEWSTVSPPEHLQLFTEQGVRSLMNRTGFRDVGVSSSGWNPLEILHAWRNRGHSNGSTNKSAGSGQDTVAGEDVKTFNRVASSYQLNEAMLATPFTRAIKVTANAALRLTGLGDTLRIAATKIIPQENTH